jgi:hypothetical protein
MSGTDRHITGGRDCCAGSLEATPLAIWNRPGLPSIEYRIGTFSAFLRTMIHNIAQWPELRDWTTRANEDYGIAVLNMWAYVADILTFYQERIANEAYLGTAIHRESVLRLAALLDYQLNPGAAAIAHLAFSAEPGKSLVIPQRLRVQSVPGQDEKPQKYETVEAIEAASQFNRFPILPQPEDDSPLDAGGFQAILTSPADELPAGTAMVFFVEGEFASSTLPPEQPVVEEKEVVEVTQENGKDVVRWQPDVIVNRHPTGQVWRFQRKHRLFGATAPSAYMKPEASAGSIKWTEETTCYESYHQGGTTAVERRDEEILNLDGAVDDLKPGTPLLVVIEPPLYRFVEADGRAYPRMRSSVTLTRVNNVQQINAAWGPLSGPATRVILDKPILPGSDFDIRCVTVYELSGPQITFWNQVYPTKIEIDTTRVYVPLARLASAEKGRKLILDDEQQQPELVTIESATPVDTDGDSDLDHLQISFTPALSRELDTATARAFGNVALATHGETVREEIVGSGDASRTFQSFPLKKSPVTFVPDPMAPSGAANTLELRVDGVLWREQRTLHGQSGTSQVYAARIDNEASMSVRFGDGVTGARLPSGQNNVVATYRHGLGLVGRVRAGTLTVPLDRPMGLKAVTNPEPSEGGADPEHMNDARQNAPNTVRTFDRIVSLRDFEDASREYTGVAKALADWRWEEGQRVVHLTVAGEGNQRLGPTALQDLIRHLDARRDRNRAMRVENYTPVPIMLRARLEPRPDYVDERVQLAAERAVKEFFSFENQQLGRPVNLSDLYEVLQRVEGVRAVDIDMLAFKPPSGPSVPSYVLDQFFYELRFRGLRMGVRYPEDVQPRLPLYPNELAQIEDPDRDIQISMGMLT